MKKSRDETEHQNAMRTADIGGLFAEPEKENWAEKYTAEHRNRDIERLVPLMIELAHRAGRSGVRVENLRVAAVQRGFLTGEEMNLDYLSAVPKRAGLVSTGVYTRNKTIKKTHGNLGVTWVLPQYAARAS